MISHKHKCIFIHISKCAGTSVEKAFGVTSQGAGEGNYETLAGWCPENKLHLHHATPQQLLDLGYISSEIWNSYYKFIIVRNPWDRALSDYFWLIQNTGKYDSFSNFVKAGGDFGDILSCRTKEYRGDHLTLQKDYFTLDGKTITYDAVVRFENTEKGFSKVTSDLALPKAFFLRRRNVNQNKLTHYSLFYTPKRKQLIAQQYGDDIKYLGYLYEEKKQLIDCVKAYNYLWFHPDRKNLLCIKYKRLYAYYKIFRLST